MLYPKIALPLEGAVNAADINNFVFTAKYLLDVMQCIFESDFAATTWGTPAHKAISLTRDALVACVVPAYPEPTYKTRGAVVEAVDKLRTCDWMVKATAEDSVQPTAES